MQLPKQESAVLPRLHDLNRGAATSSGSSGACRSPSNHQDSINTEAIGLRFLDRMSWQKDLLQVELPRDCPALFSLTSSPSKPPLVRSLDSFTSASTDRQLVRTNTSTPQQSVVGSSTRNRQHGHGSSLGALTHDESMAEVEQLLQEHAQWKQRQRAGNCKVVSTIRQSERRRDPSKMEFAFTPLRDVAMLAASAELAHEGHPTGQEMDEDSDLLATGSAGERSQDAVSTFGKYFGPGAKAAYYKTYQELHGKPQLFVEMRKPVAQSKSLKASASLSTRLQLRRPTTLASIVGGSPELVTRAKRKFALQPTHQPGSQSSTPSAETMTMTPLRASETAANASPYSPRSLFLSSCIAQRHPAISLVLRRDDCRIFDFSHQGLGDEYVSHFAACLPDLPLVEAINMADNRLSDRALEQLLQALADKPNLTMLDISENEMGRASASALRKYVSSAMCTLQRLVLNDTDVDDHECALFMVALEQNKSIRQLSLRANQVGQTRKSMALGVAATGVGTRTFSDCDGSVVPLASGGEAIGAMLNVNLTIQTLDLAWSMLRHATSTPIAKSLQLNYNLCELNLSYNGCGDIGAMFLGHALRSNSTLTTLNLAYNSVGGKGALALASGMFVNRGLTELVLDGNPVGPESGRELMQAACNRLFTTAVCVLSMFECNLISSSAPAPITSKVPANPSKLSKPGDPAVIRHVYTPSDPVGCYRLEMTDPYEHMIAHELLRIATYKPGYQIAKLEHVLPSPGKKGGASTVKIQLACRSASNSERKLPLPEPCLAAEDTGNAGAIKLLFAKIDKDNSGAVDPGELVESLVAHGFQMNIELLTRVLNEYDYDQSGTLGVEEFEDFFLRCGFEMVDIDRSGALNEFEVGKVLQLLGICNVSDREIRGMIARYDLDNSGEIDRHEFMEFMKQEVLQYRQGLPATSTAETEPSLTKSYEESALRDATGAIWTVPTTGTLILDLVYEPMDEAMEDLTPAHPRRASKTHKPRENLMLDNKSVRKLLANVQNVSKNAVEQTEFLHDVLDQQEIYFSATQAEDVLHQQGALKSWPRKLHALPRLLPQMANRVEALTLVNRLIDPALQWRQRSDLRRAVGKLYPVLLGCVTKRYRLDLHNAHDCVTLRHVALLAQEERLFSKTRAGRFDTSQSGNWENFRNGKVDGHPCLLTSHFVLNTLLARTSKTTSTAVQPGLTTLAAMVHTQSRRILEFDYVSTTRPPRGTKCMSTRRFSQLLELWTTAGELNEWSSNDRKSAATPSNTREQGANTSAIALKTHAQVLWAVLREYVISGRGNQDSPGLTASSSSSNSTAPGLVQMKRALDGIQRQLDMLEDLVCERWFSCEQARTIVDLLPNAVRARSRAVLLLFARLTDLENFISLYDSLSDEDQHECAKCLGWLNIFDPYQPDRQYPPLDLSMRDERELVQMLAQLALQEGRHTWQRASYRAASDDTAIPPASTDLPLAGWSDPDARGDDGLKRHGVVHLQYQSDANTNSASTTDNSGLPSVVGDTALRLELRERVLCGTRRYLQ